jgi:poly(3-hydroxybutyrate) depolymerase
MTPEDELPKFPLDGLFGKSIAAHAVACIVLCSGSAGIAGAEPSPGPQAQFVDRVLRDGDGEHRYVVFLPPGFTRDQTWPVILFLHGAGERGRDGRQPLEVGLGPVLKKHPESYPAIVVFPQAEELHDRILTTWAPDHPDGARALQILKEVEAEYPIDPARRVLTGWSMGGYGTWRMAAASEPGFWSAILVVSGGATPDVASMLPTSTPFWAIHGATDRVVRVSAMEQGVDAARDAGKAAFSTSLDKVGHDAWKVAYGSSDVRNWLLNPGAVDPSQVTWRADAVEALIKEYQPAESDFVAGAVISRAIAVRIENAAFAEIARGIPQAVPKERLEGDVPDINQTFEYGGTTIRAAIRKIRWSTELDSIEIVAAAAEELRVRVHLRNLRLNSSGAVVRGGAYHATTGPFEIVIAPWRPVIISAVLRPTIANGGIRLRERDIHFSISDDNWFVEEPADATASGPDLTPELVKTGVVGGLYRARSQVEDTVRRLIPSLIRRVEERLTIVPPASLAGLLWPLPTDPPRIQLRPEAIRTDSRGVSLTLAVAVAAPRNDAISRPERTVTEAGINERGASGLAVGVSPSALSALATAFQETDESHLDVLDAPEPGFAVLASPDLLVQAVPDLERFRQDHEFRTELQLAEPFALELKTASGDGPANVIGLTIHSPKVVLSTFRRRRGTFGRGEPCFETAISMTQDLNVILADETATARQVEVQWGDDPRIAGTSAFSAGHQPLDSQIDATPMVRAFTEAWTAWTESMDTTSEVVDLGMGRRRLRLDSVPVRGDRVWLQFDPVASNRPREVHIERLPTR